MCKHSNKIRSVLFIIVRDYHTMMRFFPNVPQQTKPTKRYLCSAKTLISLCICADWSEPLLCALWVAKDPRFLHADSEDWSDWAATQANLSLRWAYRSFCWFCHAVTQMMVNHAQTQGISAKLFSFGFKMFLWNSCMTELYFIHHTLLLIWIFTSWQASYSPDNMLR